MEITLNISDVVVNPELNSAEIVVTPTFSSGVPDVNKQYVDYRLSLKVDKEDGKSLVDDTEIDKIADYPELDPINGDVNKFLNERGEMVEVSHENLTDKNSEASVQHVDTTVTKETLSENDKVALYDSETGRVVLSNALNDIETILASI